MADPRFCVVLTGKCLNDLSKANVAGALQHAFKLTGEQATALLQSAPKVVKRGLDQKQAAQLIASLAKLGAQAIAQREKAAETAPTPSPIQALHDLAGKKIARPRTSLLYLSSLLLVTALCVFIPLGYLGLVAFLSLGLWQYINTFLPSLHGIHNLYVLASAYTVPPFALGVTILFLLKPFFAGRNIQAPPQYELNPKDEPEFVAGIHALCAAIGTKPPASIHLSYDVNAWVHFRHGWFGLVSNSKALTIGLPLVAGMSSQQLVGVLAHEFGHFAQGIGMRCSFVINSVNGWLETRAYQEDIWDKRLKDWRTNAENDYVVIFATLAAACFGISRALLRAAFQLSFRLSRHLSREMEFDADRHAATIAGSSHFRSTSLQVRALGKAFLEADVKNAKAFREGKLLADMPQAIAARLKKFSTADWERLELSLARAETTRYWDTHPADQARIQNAEKLGAQGYYLDTRPASELFRDFTGLSKKVTTRYYRSLGISYTSDQLVESDTVLNLNQLNDAQTLVLQRYFNGLFHPYPTLMLRPSALPDVEGMAWQATIDELRRTSPETRTRWQALSTARQERQQLAFLLLLTRLKIPFTLNNGQTLDSLSLNQNHEALESGKTESHAAMQRPLALFSRRIAHAVENLEGEARKQAESNIRLINGMQTLSKKIGELEDLRHILSVLLNGRNSLLGPTTPYEITRQKDLYANILQHLLRRCDAIPGISIGNMATLEKSLGAYLRNRCPQLEAADPESPAFLSASSPFTDAFWHVYECAVADLVGLCELAEQAAGIKPIKLIIVQKQTQEA